MNPDSQDFPLTPATKGIPVGAGELLASGISGRNFYPVSGDLQYPILTLDETVLSQNLDEMLGFASECEAVLAPHGKTPMAPALAKRVVSKGAWGVSAASLQQTAVFLKAGIRNVILANQVGGPGSAAQLVELAKLYPESSLYVFVDSHDSISAFSGLLAGVNNVGFLVETGVPGGRNGFRWAVDAKQALLTINEQFGAERIAGVATYEGAALGADMEESIRKVEQLMALTAEVFEFARAFSPGKDLILTAGGSALYDIVARRLAPVASASAPSRLVLRGGAFLLHDHGIYDRLLRAMDERAGYRRGGQVVSAASRYKPALRLWVQVQSCPEPGRVIAGFGMRDVSYDIELPKVLSAYRGGQKLPDDKAPAADITVEKLNDQHGFLKTTGNVQLKVGDILELGISHPCTCLDKWRVIFGVDETGKIVNAYQTFF